MNVASIAVLAVVAIAAAAAMFFIHRGRRSSKDCEGCALRSFCGKD